MKSVGDGQILEILKKLTECCEVLRGEPNKPKFTTEGKNRRNSEETTVQKRKHTEFGPKFLHTFSRARAGAGVARVALGVSGDLGELCAPKTDRYQFGVKSL